MAAQGFGWCILPCALVEEFAPQAAGGADIPGWPRAISVDLLWNKKAPPGKPAAGCVSICSGVNVNEAISL
jgi:DNA-binding transcriptional LysR family regulator